MTRETRTLLVSELLDLGTKHPYMETSSFNTSWRPNETFLYLFAVTLLSPNKLLI